MAKIIKSHLGNFLVICLIFLIVGGWIFSGWPQIWKKPPFPPKIQEAQAALPTWVGIGALSSGTGGRTCGHPIETLQTNDILLLFVETSNEAVIVDGGGGIWAEVTDSPQGTGSSPGGTSLTVFWSRYDGSQAAPTISDSGNHQMCQVIAVRGVITTGNPWDVTAGAVEATSDTSGSIPGDTTTVDDTFIVLAIAIDGPDGNSTANFSDWANTDLGSLAEQGDNRKNSGDGGGIGIATGTLASQGSYAATTVTLANNATKGMMSIALEPPPPTTTITSGTDPATTTVAPESGIADAGAFTFQASADSDSVTALTVILAGAETPYDGMSEVCYKR